MDQTEVTINGKNYPCVEYVDDMGELTFPDEVIKLLSALPFEEQVKHYSIIECGRLTKSYYGEEGSSRDFPAHTIPFLNYTAIEKLIIHNGMIVGAVIQGYYGLRNLLPDRGVCVYDVYETDGSGVNERTDYAYLIVKT